MLEHVSLVSVSFYERVVNESKYSMIRVTLVKKLANAQGMGQSELQGYIPKHDKRMVFITASWAHKKSENITKSPYLSRKV